MTSYLLDHWNSQADKHGTNHTASWGDEYALALEIDTISKYIKDDDTVLDVGCANGFSTFHFLDNILCSIVGIDFSAAMIREARKVKDSHRYSNRISFEVGDARNIQYKDDTFDVVYTTRTIINLPRWSEQEKAISECIRVCKKGGTIILSEAFWEPLVLLNSMRALTSLPPLVEHDFNRYLKMRYLDNFLRLNNLDFNVIDFSSIYYLGSRFIRELVTNTEDYPGYSNPINKIFYNIEKEYSGGGLGIQQAYIINK